MVLSPRGESFNIENCTPHSASRQQSLTQHSGLIYCSVLARNTRYYNLSLGTSCLVYFTFLLLRIHKTDSPVFRHHVWKRQACPQRPHSPPAALILPSNLLRVSFKAWHTLLTYTVFFRHPQPSLTSGVIEAAGAHGFSWKKRGVRTKPPGPLTKLGGSKRRGQKESGGVAEK
ncbi:hypothetical protein HJG60_008286 [Phyllostomus discolor]|uniref:Uncharacterized protein n=1 Tax=Phyllostomus discolor TaxID=89673 RepID=A0A834DPD3_9CHIR|nr:hypothetical protein HJG60_008286 [Phyllostomus discolor]